MGNLQKWTWLVVDPKITTRRFLCDNFFRTIHLLFAGSKLKASTT